MNRSLLVLKEWPADRTISNIDFDTATFYVQIHGLPPMFLHEETAMKIGKQIKILHMDSIHRRCVVGMRHLRIRVDIAISEPLLGGFFQNRNDGGNYWVQFKYECLLDFCYKCGAFNHVIEKCQFGEQATITSVK